MSYVPRRIAETTTRRRSNVFGDARFWFCPNLITF